MKESIVIEIEKRQRAIDERRNDITTRATRLLEMLDSLHYEFEEKPRTPTNSTATGEWFSFR